MTNFNEYASRVLAGFGAVAMTLTLIVSSFSTPQASLISSIIA